MSEYVPPGDKHEEVGLLRFATAGSVDDGKSTLIGRLLYDAKGLFEDQLAALEADFDLARITDGLRAEREQGITIDVAHRYFATPRRRFMIADCPGHVQYTKNTVTGMSEADVCVLLVDVRKGIQQQTRRHAQLAAMLGLSGLVVCVNKMDLVGWKEEAFRTVEAEIRSVLGPLGIPELHLIPMSALEGASVTRRDPRLDWYEGPTLLELLETVEPSKEEPEGGRLPVQIVLRPEHGEGRSYAGRIASGGFQVGEEVVILPSGVRTQVKAIDTFNGSLDEARAPQSIALRFVDEVDAARGDLVASADGAPEPKRRFAATVVWMGEKPLLPSSRYILKLGTQKTKVIVRGLESRFDVDRLEYVSEAACLDMNDVGRADLETLDVIPAEDFRDRPSNGRFIMVDPLTKETVGAGLIGAR